METDASNIPLPTNEDLSPTEQDLLDEYERLAENMKTVCLPTLFSSLFLLSPLALSPSHLCPSPFFLPYPNSITWLIKLTKVRNSSRTLSKQCPITPQLTSLIICANWSGKQVWFLRCWKRVFIVLCCSSRLVRRGMTMVEERGVRRVIMSKVVEMVEIVGEGGVLCTIAWLRSRIFTHIW